jgi:hypothetical protein
MKDQTKSRRKILGNLLVFGSSLAVIVKIKDLFIEKPKPIRLIGKDGKVVEIDPKHYPKMCAGKVSNKKLLNWIQSKEKGNV